jgi:hypothetical protein
MGLQTVFRYCSSNPDDQSAAFSLIEHLKTSALYEIIGNLDAVFPGLSDRTTEQFRTNDAFWKSSSLPMPNATGIAVVSAINSRMRCLKV